jgi:3-hydroxybutyryl-CoA dehydrogenase
LSGGGEPAPDGAPAPESGDAPPLRVSLLGAGVMGRNIARVFLRAGAVVTLVSRSDATLDSARAALAGEALERLTTTREVAGGDLVLESVPERVELKRELLAQAEAAMPDDAILATNTSSLPLDDLARDLRRPERFLGLHWFNPAHLVPLVEVVPASTTDPAIVDRSVGLLEAAGKRPLRLARSVPGFVANRLQYALIREALQLLEDGVADAEGIDLVLTQCLGPRWAVIGPLTSTDLAGVETAIAVARQLYPELSDAREPQRVLLELAEQGRLGVRSGHGFHAYPDPVATEAARDAGLTAVLQSQKPSERR